jgi:hypothetical protein
MFCSSRDSYGWLACLNLALTAGAILAAAAPEVRQWMLINAADWRFVWLLLQSCAVCASVAHV